MIYSFKLDTLQKVWHRQWFEVEASSEKEAIEKAIEVAKEEEEYGEIGEEVTYSEYLIEAGTEQVLVEENEGNPTIELIYDDQTLWTNNQIKL